MNANIINVILNGMMTQDKELCIKRLSNILAVQGDSSIEALVNGIIVDALIASDQDEALVRATFTKQFNRDNWKRFEVSVDDYSTVRVRGFYDKTIYCKTQEEADSRLRTGYGDTQDRADEVYKVPVVVEAASSKCYGLENASKCGITLVLN